MVQTIWHGIVLRSSDRVVTQRRFIPPITSAYSYQLVRNRRPVLTLAVACVDKVKRRIAALRRVQKWRNDQAEIL